MSIIAAHGTKIAVTEEKGTIGIVLVNNEILLIKYCQIKVVVYEMRRLTL